MPDQPDDYGLSAARISSWFQRNAGPAIDMWRNAERYWGEGNAAKQHQLAEFLGVPDESVGLGLGLMGGIKAPGQPVRIPNPIKPVFHGSPYDFKPTPGNPLGEFDLSKIGTGEGAQAYGHGLYFAENEAVAKQYRDDLTNRKNAWSSMFRREDPPGRMYEVALHATPESFLDWDKPLSAQPQAVRDFVAKNHPEAIANNPDMTGAGVWKGSDVIGGRTPEGQSEAAKKLAEAGIPGVRYLDQKSRLTDAQLAEKMIKEGYNYKPPTHNYVVWSPEIIQILRKYGIIGPAFGAPMINALTGGNPQQQQQQ